MERYEETLKLIRNPNIVDYYKARLIASLPDDELKIELLELAGGYDSIVIASLSDDEQKIAWLENVRKTYGYAYSDVGKQLNYIQEGYVIAGLSDDAEKLKWLRVVQGYMIDEKGKIRSAYTQSKNYTEGVTRVVASLKDKRPAKWLATHIAMDSDVIKEVIDSLENDEEKLDALKGATARSQPCIIASLSDDSKKLELLNRLNNDSARAQVIASLSDDSKKLELSKGMNELALADVIVSLSDDSKKLELLKGIKREYVKATIVASLSDDNLKKEFLRNIKKTDHKDIIIMSMSNIDRKLFSRLSCWARIQVLLSPDNKPKEVVHVKKAENNHNIEELSIEELEQMVAEQDSITERQANEIQQLKEEAATREFYLEKKKKEIEFLKSQGAKVETDEERAKREEKEHRESLLVRLKEQREKVKQQQDEKLELIAKIKEQELESINLDKERRGMEK